MSQCKKTYTIEDEVCEMDLLCELPENHEGNHKIFYPGLDGEVAIPVYWDDARGKQKTEFYRNKVVGEMTGASWDETPVMVMDSDLDESLEKGDLIECPNCGKEHRIELAKNAAGVETKMMMFVQCDGKSICVGIDGRRWK